MRKSKQFLALLFGLFVLLSGSREVLADVILLGAGDMVRITVYGHTDLTAATRINEEGKISFPLIGDVMIGGLSTSDAEAKIANLLLKDGFVKDAQVSIFVEERRQSLINSVVILGLVTKPGIYPLQSLSAEGVQTIIDLLAMAGGTSMNAADRAILIRKGGSKEKNTVIDLVELLDHGDIQRNLVLSGGDVVFVPEMDVIYIYGQIQHPGRYRLERNMSVMQAVSVGGGVTERGNEDGLYIKRRKGNGVETLNAKMTDTLQPDDVLYVKESVF